MNKSKQQFPFLLGYGIGDFGLNIYWNTLSLILVFWYAEVVGLSPQTAGLIYLIGSFWDAVSDPIMASIAEQNRSRHGTYRPFILYGGLLLAIAFCLLFWIPPFEGMMLVVYLTITHVVFRTCYTLVAVPYSAMSSRLTFNSFERTKLSSVRMMFAFVGLLTVSSLWFPLTRLFAADEQISDQSFFYAAVIGATIASVALLLCFVLTKELVPPGQADQPKVSWLKGFAKAIASNHALRVLLAIVFLQSGAYASLRIPLAFYIEANAYQFARIEVIMTAFAVTILCSIPLWTYLTGTIGRKKVWAFACGWVVFCGLHFLLFEPAIIGGIPVQIVLIGAGFGAFSVLIWAMIPDTIEYGQFAYGERAEGAVFGSVLFAQKVSSGIMGLTVGWVLSWIGYDPGRDVQTVVVATDLGVFLALIPGALLILSTFTIMQLPLNKEIHAKIVDQLSK